VKLAESTARLSRRFQKFPRISRDQTDTTSVIDLQTANQSIDEDHQQPILAVKDSLSALQTQIDKFQKEVDLCAHERLGEIKKDTTDIKRSQIGLMYLVEQNTRCQ
jgi:hypothetical protein